MQLTPPGSACSIMVGVGITDTPPGSVRGLHLVVTDIEAAREELVARGVDVATVRHMTPQGFVDGVDPHARRLQLVRRVRRPGRQHLGAAGAGHG